MKSRMSIQDHSRPIHNHEQDWISLLIRDLRDLKAIGSDLKLPMSRLIYWVACKKFLSGCSEFKISGTHKKHNRLIETMDKLINALYERREGKDTPIPDEWLDNIEREANGLSSCREDLIKY